MRALLVASLTFVTCLSTTCPAEYQETDGNMCMRFQDILKHTTLDILLPSSRNDCGRDGAHLPIIKNEQENRIFNNIIESFNRLYGTFLVLDLVCNNITGRLEWIDGTSVTYTGPTDLFINFDCVSADSTVISNPALNEWNVVNNKEQWYFTVLCVIDTVEPFVPCGSKDYSPMDNPSDSSKPCLKENKYFWRTAISNNILEGMHIGAHQSPEDSSVWSWSDGEAPIDGKTYDNFMSLFPIPGGGECSSMLTGTTDALWINENCEENEQPFMCRRADFSTLPKSCPTDEPKAGEDIYSPGLPNSDIPCAYMLFVSAGKLVELEVITLIAEDNKDFLEILEATSGPHPIANLTGTILVPAKFRTEKSNVIRVAWQPGGSGSGRGYRIRYNEVDP